MAMAEAATLPPTYKLLLVVSLPLLSSRATRRLPLVPLITSSDAVEAGIEWIESGGEAEVGDTFEEIGEEEGELVASSEEEDDDLEMDYPTVVEPPEEAKVYVRNLPYDIWPEPWIWFRYHDLFPIVCSHDYCVIDLLLRFLPSTFS
jgi:nucleolin